MDPSQEHAANALAGLGVGLFLFIGLFVLVLLAFIIFCLWRVFTKAGFPGGLAFLILVPGIGQLIILCILAFADWKVVPAPTYAYPPQYPPPPPPPPSAYTPQV